MPEPKWAGRDKKPGEGPTSLTELTDVTGDPGYGKSPVDDGTETFALTRVTTQEDLDAILSAVAEVDYHHVGDPDEPPFLNGFANYDSPRFVPLRWRHARNSVVHLEGVVKSAAPLTTQTPIFVLPAEIRPLERLVFCCQSEKTVSRVDVLPDGNVRWNNYLAGDTGAETMLSLCGLKWSIPSLELLRRVAERFGADG